MHKVFVYIDYTADGRPFYVGKGSAARVKQFKRNHHHGGVAAKYGWKREVVLELTDEFEANCWEIRLIAALHTFVGDTLYGGVGANHTIGGEGQAGFHMSDAAKQHLSRLNRGSKRPDASLRRKGVKLSCETRLKISAAQRGCKRPPFTAEHCEAISKGKSGKKRAPFSEEWRAKMSASRTGVKRGPYKKRAIHE